jgi:protein NrfD
MWRIQEIVFWVLSPLTVGGALLMTLPSLEAAGISFFRTNGLVFLITGICSLTILPVHTAAGGGDGGLFFAFLPFLLVLSVYNLRLWLRHPRHSRPLLWTAVLLGNVAVLLAVRRHIATSESPPWGAFALWADLMASGLFLGAGVLAMLLGHRYLTSPSLSMVPLRNLSLIFAGLIAWKTGVVLLGLYGLWQVPWLHAAFFIHTLEGVYLWIRLLIGLVGPMILAPMILQTVKERATMSATGLLYIAMLMAIIGEIVARFFLLTRATIL